MSNVEKRCFIVNKIKETRKKLTYETKQEEQKKLFLFIKDMENTLMLLKELAVKEYLH
jgi:hypothetical protein